MDNSKNLMRAALATMAFAAAGAVQADEIWGPEVRQPAGGYVAMGNTGYGWQTSYTHQILSSAQETSLNAFLAANPLEQAGILSLYFADDSDSGSEYFQYRLNGTGAWIGGLTTAYEVDGSVCYSGTLSTPACKAGYYSFDIALDSLALASLLAPAGAPTIQIRVNPDYEEQYVSGYTYTTYVYGQCSGEKVKKNNQWKCKVPTYATRDLPQDFYFKGSIFTASGDKPREVPEPATFGLLGLGMIGVGLARRRRAQKA